MLATRVPLPRVSLPRVSRVSLPRVSRVVLAITCTVSHVSSPAPHGRSMATRLHALLLVLLLHVKHVTPANTRVSGLAVVNIPILTVRVARVPVGHPEVQHGVEQQTAVWGQEHGGRSGCRYPHILPLLSSLYYLVSVLSSLCMI